MRSALSSGLLVVALALAAAAFVAATEERSVDDRWTPPRLTDTVQSLGSFDHPTPAPGSVVVLSYGRISADPDEQDVSVADFARQIVALRSAGAEFVGADSIEDILGGRPDAPPLAVAIVVEDTSVSLWNDVDPVLEAYGARAIAALTTDAVVVAGPSSRLTTDMVRDLADSGRWDLAVRGPGSLPVGTGRPITVDGSDSGRGTGLHFRGFGPWAATAGTGSNALTRLRVSATSSPAEVVELAVGSLPTPPKGLEALELVDPPGWCIAHDHSVLISGTGYSRCRFYGNDALWTDYSVATTVHRQRGGTAVVVLRDDGERRIELALGQVEALLRVVRDGTAVTVDSVDLDSDVDANEVVIEVVGQSVEADIDGRLVSASGDGRLPARGLVGFAAAGSSRGPVRFSHIEIDQIRVLTSGSPIPTVPER